MTLSSSQKKESSSAPSASSPEARNRTFPGGGEMGALMRAYDWSTTPLGPVEQWPQSLKTAARIILTSRYAMFVWWGRELVNLYNDPYRAFLGIKHPAALGKSARDVWSEIWDQIGPRTDAVLLRGESTFDEALLLLMERHGYLEETYFTFAYSPLPDDAGNVGGLFCAVTEETEQVIGERRLTLLREIGAEMAECRTPQQVCEAAARCLSDARRDLPFSLIYLLDPDGKTLRRAAQAGIAVDHPAAPDSFTLGERAGSPWPFDEVMQREDAVLLNDLADRIADIPLGEWSHPADCAILLPIAQQGQARPAGVFVAGINPHRKFAEKFRGFVKLLVNQIAAAIANAVAYEAERRRAEALAELDHAKTKFFSNVSHEFRTPLTLLLGPLEEVLTKAEEHLNAEDQQQLEAVHRNALRLLKLVNTLLDFSRIEAGQVQASFEPTDLCKLTEELASAFQSAMVNAGLRFTVHCQPLDRPIYVDREMWEKVVLNLLSNAFKFTFEGEVALCLRDAGDTVELIVRDTGVGIPQAEQGRIFERFHRVESTRARTYEGTGIGLSLVHELTKLHGGSVRVKSGPGHGSTFTVAIPKGKAHLPSERVQPTAGGPKAHMFDSYVQEAESWLSHEGGTSAEAAGTIAVPLTVEDTSALTGSQRELIVLADDNADMRDYVRRLLGSQYRVLAVSDGIYALEAARRLHPTLVLADVMMPRLDGFGMLHAIRNDPELRGIPIILLSARAGEESEVEGLEAGADDYLVKPFTARELLARVATHVRMAKLRRESEEREARLRAAAELERGRLQDMLTQVPAVIGLMEGPEHRWTYVNEQFIRTTGRNSAEDFLGKTVRESMPELDPILLELLDEVYRTGKPYVTTEWKTTLNRAESGQPAEAYFDFAYQPLRNLHGEVGGVLVHAVEVTDKVTTRRKLEQSEKRLRLAQAAAQVGTWEWDPVDDSSSLSPELHCIFGTDRNDPEHKRHWAERVHPDDRENVQRSMQAGHLSGSMEFEYRYNHPQNGLRWFYCKGQRVGPESRMLGVVLDITERKHSEEAQHKLAAIVESSEDAIVSKNLQGGVTSWNAAAERMFGYTAGEMIGRPITTIIPPELQADEALILATIASGQRIDHFETVRLAKNGERINVSLTISPVRDEAGRIVGAAKIARDISERKKAEQVLRTSEKLASVGRLAATVAHEINNPLEAVTNLIYLAKSCAAGDDVKQYLTAAEEELIRISHLTRQTLGFYREAKGAAAPVKLSGLVTSLLSVFASRLRNKGISVVSEIKHDPEIVAVPGEMRQLLANLISNSIDAVPSGGQVRVRVSAAMEPNSRRRSGVRLTVADSGPGIAAGNQPKLFEPFFTTKKDVGTGLGLWVCKSIVEKHSGQIRVKSSTRPGRSWTAFSVFLPLAAQGTLAEQALQEAV